MLKRVSLLSFSLLLGLTACETFKRDNSNTQKIAEQLQQQQANMNNYFQSMADQMAIINGNIQQLNEHDQALSNQIQYLQTRVNAISQQADISTSVQSEINAIRQELKAVDNARIKDTTKIVDSLSSKIVEVSKQNDELSKSLRQISSRPEPRPATTKEYFQHTVGAGETLGAIATAYKVNIEIIRKENNIKNNIIRIGQKLRIPKTK